MWFMSGTVWILGLGILYLVLLRPAASCCVLLLTVAILTFRKGHRVLGLIGIVFPDPRALGAVLPDRRAYHR